MKTKNSPFSTHTFQKVWKKHFILNTPINTYRFLDGVSFYKNKRSVFLNLGKNLTKGNTYKINNHNDYKGKTFVIYDVLPHLNAKQNNLPENLGVLKSVQYPGFLIELDTFKTIDDYLLNTFSKNTRAKMRKFNKILNTCFKISTKMFFGNIDKQEYDEIFEKFMLLLQKRYSEKQVFYNNMQPTEWRFYKEVARPLILEKKASLFVVYNKETPIAITYNYHTEDALIDAITVFDIDYSKFNIGYLNNLKLLNWCFENNIKTLDFSKGYFDYKKRMCTRQYDFEHHIIYDKTSFISTLKAHTYHNFFRFKAYLRNKKFDVKFHKFTYKLKNKKQSKIDVEITELKTLPSPNELIKIDIKQDTNYSLLIKYINNFLYLVIKPYNEIESFKVKNRTGVYILSSHSLIQQLKLP
jgi:hypothetical protein